MPLLGSAAIAMWWDMAPEQRPEFEDWHSTEHLPERVGIAGFRRGSRWASADGGDGYFVMYELQSYKTLTSPAYLTRLNHPTPWSVKMMPHHRNMVRSQCRVLDSFGGGLAGFMLTLRLSPQPGRDDALHALLRHGLRALVAQPGFTGGHLLQTQTPQAAATTEQKIRGGDGVADWIVLVSGCAKQALLDVSAKELGESALGEAGALPGRMPGLYRLSHAVMPGDL